MDMFEKKEVPDGYEARKTEILQAGAIRLKVVLVVFYACKKCGAMCCYRDCDTHTIWHLKNETVLVN